MLKEFLDILAKADGVYIVKSRQTRVTVVPLVPTGEATAEVVRLLYGNKTVRLTEEGINGGKFDAEKDAFLVYDEAGFDIYVRMKLKGATLRAAKEFEDFTGPAHLVVQEGGSSSELYVHALSTSAQASLHQRNCWNEGAYRTTEVVEVPASLASHPDFMRVAEALVAATLTLESRGD